MKVFFTGLLLFAVLSSLHATQPCGNCAPLIFKENKGQWEPKVLYKAEIKNGAVFFEENSITFNLFDTRDIIRIKGDHHRMENYKPNIDYTIHYHAFKMKFGSTSGTKPVVAGGAAIKEYFNYFIGNDQSKWASKVRAFEEISYPSLYKGIGLKIASQDGLMKYVYEVKPGIDAKMLKVDFEGVDGLSLNSQGDLVIKTSVGDVIDLKPYAYQMDKGNEVVVACSFNLLENSLQYHFPNGYDASKTLYVDPTLVFSTYSGSTSDNFGFSATFDSKGNAFAAGTVFGTGYPVTVGAYQTSYVGGPNVVFTTGGAYPGDDIGITKYSSDGSQRLYSTYLGGYGQELPHSLITNSLDELYVLGTTSCMDFPVTLLAYDRSFNGGNDPGVFDGIAAHYRDGSDIFISKFSVDGSQLLASTFVGGSGNDGLNYRAGQPYSSPGFLRHNYADEVRGEIEIDLNNNIYVASCTRSADFPRTSNTFQPNFGGGQDACIFKMDANLSTMIWSTTFGGSDDDAAYSVAIDKEENLFVAGGTRSLNFPTHSGAFQTAFGGGEADGFLTHINKNGQVLTASTYYGFKEYDQIYFVDLDKANNVYVFGQADSSQTRYIKNALYNKPNGGQFISKFNKNLDTLVWATSFGRGIAKTDISPTAFLVDVCSNIYACGWGSQGVNNIVGGTGGTTGLDVTSNALKPTTDGQDFYLMVMRDDASALSYGTFLGGDLSEEHVDGGTSRFDRKGVVYQSVCAGCGGHSDFPTTPNAVSRTNNSSNCNVAVFKFDLNLPLIIADFTPQNGCRNLPIPFVNNSSSVLSPSYQWFFGDNQTSSQQNPVHTFAQSGLYEVMLVVTDPGSCNASDTMVRKILVLGGADTTKNLPPITICEAQTTQIGLPPSSDTSFVYQWIPANTLSAANVSNPVASPAQTTTYQLLVSNGDCVDTFYQTVVIFSDVLNVEGNDISCLGDTVRLSVINSQPNQQLTYSWEPANQIISGANTANPVVNPAQNTTFKVKVVNQIGCTVTDSIRINILSQSPAVDAVATPATIELGDTSQISLATSSDVISIRWTPDSTLSAENISDPMAYPKQTHTYYVEVENEQGCRKTDSVTVNVIFPPCDESQLFIPTGFSPNGDGKNDVLYVRASFVANIYFAVYDRWGQKIFETKDITKGWDGSFKGKN
ncbi:MAG: gliding motility-associated C-terminal domain-containing protein [Bacteroidetes bacterium]|nr:gliding motility-associated C-terminal domain-containing protein [Bacteroidota bacterium]